MVQFSRSGLDQVVDGLSQNFLGPIQAYDGHRARSDVPAEHGEEKQ